MPADSKQAEKDYLRRTADASWDRAKPFSPAGAHTLDESARLIHDFAIAIQTMTPGPGDVVLDLGAGACWCSDWLRRLNIKTVAVDISWDMLALGKTRLPAGQTGGLVAGDMESLPFATGTFDMAFCLNALHHAPDMPAALREISRVLAPHGAVFFSEPGAGHSAMSESVAAMRDFGVLDQDVLVAQFVSQCHDAGFADVSIQALSYSLPQCQLTVDEWQAWDRWSRTPRPIRAATKMWRAALEVFGLKKHTDLVEETFTMEVMRRLHASIEHHPVIVARKSSDARGPRATYAAAIDARTAPTTARAGAAMDFRIDLRNTGTATWHTSLSGRDNPVRLGVQLLDADLRVLDLDYYRQDLPDTVPAGGACTLDLAFHVPTKPGRYCLKLDLVAEGLTWFERAGSVVSLIRLSVT